MRKTSTVLTLGACFLALTGCQALFGTSSFASQAPSVDVASLDMSDYFTARLEAGRIHLAQGRPAAAVTAFRQASYNAAHAGPAYNGMGVAYAQLGRQDLARRYFEMAVAADPVDERFARDGGIRLAAFAFRND
jgi:Flp pilus assembly protein TadD